MEEYKMKAWVLPNGRLASIKIILDKKEDSEEKKK
jgi:hypothetical protein